MDIYPGTLKKGLDAFGVFRYIEQTFIAIRAVFVFLGR